MRFYVVVPRISFKVLQMVCLLSTKEGDCIMTALLSSPRAGRRHAAEHRERKEKLTDILLSFKEDSKSTTRILSGRFPFPDKPHRYGRGNGSVPNMKHYEVAFTSAASILWAWVKAISKQMGDVFFFARAKSSLLWRLKRGLKPEIASYLMVIPKTFNYFQIVRPKHNRQRSHPSTLFMYRSVHFQEEEKIKLVKTSHLNHVIPCNKLQINK